MASSNRFGGAMVQRKATDTKGNFVLVVPGKTGGLYIYERKNDLTEPKWFGPAAVPNSPGIYDGVSIFETAGSGRFNFAAVKNLGIEDGQLWWYWDQLIFKPQALETSAPNAPSPPPVLIADRNCKGVPACVQSSYGSGDMEVIIPQVGQAGMHHYSCRDGVWSKTAEFGGDWNVLGVSMIQSFFNNLEAVAVQWKGNDYGDLVHYYFNAQTRKWDKTVVIGKNFKGSPAIIQSGIGHNGNFEVVVARRGGGLTHYGRDNDHSPFPWNTPTNFGTADYVSVSLIESNFGTPGVLDVAALRGDGKVDTFWRSPGPAYVWYGPFTINT